MRVCESDTMISWWWGFLPLFEGKSITRLLKHTQLLQWPFFSACIAQLCRAWLSYELCHPSGLSVYLSVTNGSIPKQMVIGSHGFHRWVAWGFQFFLNQILYGTGRSQVNTSCEGWVKWHKILFSGFFIAVSPKWWEIWPVVGNCIWAFVWCQCRWSWMTMIAFS